MFHNFKYSFKILFRSKMLIFWTFAFPIILGTFFSMAFSNIEKSEKLETIDIAIVNNQEFKKDQILSQTFKTLGDSKNKDYLFNIKYKNEKQCQKLLQNDKIAGYLIVQKDTPKVVLNKNGINETILKYVVDDIIQKREIISKIVASDVEQSIKNINYKSIHEKALNMTLIEQDNIKDVSKSNLSYTMIEFYTLIAMTCLYGGILGMTSINQTLANMSYNGKRVSISPISKGKLILSSVLASYVVQLIGLALLFLYTILVLNVDYGNNLFLIMLLALLGSLAGLTIGIAVGTLIKSNENTKTGIIISVTMLGSFLSGMMGITMKYVIDKNVPILNKVNPASMITDGLYSLYYYDTFNRYIFNIISLLIFSVVMILISYFSLRRQKYDSI